MIMINDRKMVVVIGKGNQFRGTIVFLALKNYCNLTNTLRMGLIANYNLIRSDV